MMKILQLCKKLPFPLNDGESIAVDAMSKSLSRLGAKIDLLSMNTSKHWVDVDQVQLPSYYGFVATVKHNNNVRYRDAFKNLFSNDSFHIERYINKEFEDKLVQLLKDQKYDIVQLETIYMAPYIEAIRKHSKAKIVLRAHNLEYEIWQNLAGAKSNSLKNWYLNLCASRLKKYEIENIKNVDLLVSISDTDFDKFSALGCTNLFNCPVGLDLSQYPDESPKTQDLCFIGSLDWLPNIEALKWFIDLVWPILKEREKDIRFHIAGRNAGDNLRSYQSIAGLLIHGEVESSVDFINSHPIMVVPLLSGSGIRIKILEGLALKRAVVTSAKGLEGIGCRDGEELYIADNPEDFADKILKVYKNEQMIKQFGEKGHEYIKNNFNQATFAERLLKEYQSLLSNKTEL